jgi:hypothetical protein
MLMKRFIGQHQLQKGVCGTYASQPERSRNHISHAGLANALKTEK